MRLVQEALTTWPDVPPPEDGYARLDSRLSFAPPPAIPLRPRRVRHLVAPYFAGVATAACLMLLLSNPFGGTPSASNETPVNESVADGTGLLPGERALEPVLANTGDGYLIEFRPDEETLRRLPPDLRRQLLDRLPLTSTVDYEAK